MSEIRVCCPSGQTALAASSDGHRAGATLREIAIAIYGRERIDRDWPGNGLERRLRRDLQRGRALCSGGYRDLIR